MRQDRILLLSVMVAIVLAILLTMGVGYAAETGEFKISENPAFASEQSDFRVEFSGEPTYIGNGEATVKLTSPTTMTMNITNLKNVGDYVTVICTIENNSSELYANIKTTVRNTNTEYFNVKAFLSESTIKPKTGKTTLEITVELIKMPFQKEQKTNIRVNILAKPITE